MADDRDHRRGVLASDSDADRPGRAGHGDGRADEAVERWRAVLAHPCAHHQVAAYEILDEIHRAYREAGHYEDAIAAKREAIAAGYRSVPDPEADIAECLLEAGHIEEADALFATLRERDPEDVWLYDSAAYSYAGIDVATSLRWALDGIEVALATGDPDQVVMQLLELVEDAWEALGEPADHLAYSQATEARIKRVARYAPGHRLHVAAMTVDGLEAHADASGNAPGSGQARSFYAATLLQAGDAVGWSPGCNEACWCGSEREYKKCCGPVLAAADGAS